MSTNFNDIVKQSPVKIKNKLGIYQQWFVILRRPSSRGPLRLEKYKDEKASMLMEGAVKSYELKDVHEIDHFRKDGKNTINVLFENGKSFQMDLHIESEARDWLLILRDMCQPSSGQRDGSTGVDLSLNGRKKDVFNVFLLETPLMNAHGECLLQITSDSIYLLDVDNPRKCLMVWPLPSIRRYCRDETKFTFESGRSCKTGEGIFIFNTVHSEEIYQRVWSASNAIAQTCQLTEISRRNLSVENTSTRNAQRPLPPTPARGAPLLPARRH